MSLPGHRGQDTHLNASSTSPSFSWARDAHPTPGERPRGRSLLHCAHSSRDADLAGLWESFLHPPHGSVQPPRPFEGLGFSSFLFYSCFFLVVLGWVREGDMVNAAATSAGLPAGLTLPLSPGPSAPNPGDEGGLLTLIPKTRKTGRDLGAQSVTARTKWQALTCNSRKRHRAVTFSINSFVREQTCGPRCPHLLGGLEEFGVGRTLVYELAVARKAHAPLLPPISTPPRPLRQPVTSCCSLLTAQDPVTRG